MRYRTALLLLLLSAGTAGARTWLFFEQLPRSGDFAGTERSALRLQKAGVDITAAENYSVDRAWLAELREQGAEIHTVSRWLNAVSIADDPQLVELLSRHYPIRSVREVQTFRRELPVDQPLSAKSHPSSADDPFYGDSWTQLAQMGIPELHEQGYTGSGILIGMLDTGWDLERAALSQADVIATWDFFFNDPDVADEDEDPAGQDGHGTKTLGCIAAWAPQNLIGVAYDASFALAKTERLGQEVNAEEDDFVAGLEWLDSLGVDIASSSLGYSRFDPDQNSYTVDDLDGNTCVTTVACDLAAARGIFVATSAGNEGNDYNWQGRITSPADGDSVIAVGSIRADSTISAFSSRGPTADGRIKPDLVAMGERVLVINTNPQSPSSYVLSSGTSFAAPLLAGSAALLLQRDPRLLPMELAELMKANASHTAVPDTAYGWGIPDVPRIWEQLDPPYELAQNEIRLYPNPFNSSLRFLIESEADELYPMRIKMYDLLGRIVYNRLVAAAPGDEITINPPVELADGIYFAVFSSIETGRVFGKKKCIKLEY